MERIFQVHLGLQDFHVGCHLLGHEGARGFAADFQPLDGLLQAAPVFARFEQLQILFLDTSDQPPFLAFLVQKRRLRLDLSLAVAVENGPARKQGLLQIDAPVLLILIDVIIIRRASGTDAFEPSLAVAGRKVGKENAP